MTAPADPLTTSAADLQASFARLALPWLRAANAACDALFYDVNVLAIELAWRGAIIGFGTGDAAFAGLDFAALASPDGCILVIDPSQPPYVTRFGQTESFAAFAGAGGRDITTVSVSGVARSALGATAFGWNVATGLGRRVAAIVPALSPDPSAATPLLALLEQVPWIDTLVGHGSGAADIGATLQALPADAARRLTAVTLGGPIAESVADVDYRQFLGAFDPVGWWQRWSNLPDSWLPAHHGTNTAVPFSLPVAALCRIAQSRRPARQVPPRLMLAASN